MHLESALQQITHTHTYTHTLCFCERSGYRTMPLAKCVCETLIIMVKMSGKFFLVRVHELLVTVVLLVMWVLVVWDGVRWDPTRCPKRAWQQTTMCWDHHRQRLGHRLLPGRRVIRNLPLVADPHMQDMKSGLLLWFLFPLYLVCVCRYYLCYRKQRNLNVKQAIWFGNGACRQVMRTIVWLRRQSWKPFWSVSASVTRAMISGQDQSNDLWLLTSPAPLF